MNTRSDGDTTAGPGRPAAGGEVAKSAGRTARISISASGAASADPGEILRTSQAGRQLDAAIRISNKKTMEPATGG